MIFQVLIFSSMQAMTLSNSSSPPTLSLVRLEHALHTPHSIALGVDSTGGVLGSNDGSVEDVPSDADGGRCCRGNSSSQSMGAWIGLLGAHLGCFVIWCRGGREVKSSPVNSSLLESMALWN